VIFRGFADPCYDRGLRRCLCLDPIARRTRAISDVHSDWTDRQHSPGVPSDTLTVTWTASTIYCERTRSKCEAVCQRGGTRSNSIPRAPCSDSFIDFNNTALARFSQAERMQIGVHTSPGGDWGSTHREDRADTSTTCNAPVAEIPSRLRGTALAARELGL
jgi:hypothetical protein